MVVVVVVVVVAVAVAVFDMASQPTYLILEYESQMGNWKLASRTPRSSSPMANGDPSGGDGASALPSANQQPRATIICQDGTRRAGVAHGLSVVITRCALPLLAQNKESSYASWDWRPWQMLSEASDSHKAMGDRRRSTREPPASRTSVWQVASLQPTLRAGNELSYCGLGSQHDKADAVGECEEQRVAMEDGGDGGKQASFRQDKGHSSCRLSRTITASICSRGV
ncbi:hypothetical protein B0T26DRAFT_670212 [Lasiosphaeria miniovina]|uniref:Uncharacterized protein n=1 Tax=Lasiosphaeria miniovina TaxID=1954250 RepID=A0AA40BGL6_9PEZI|nr:uncharacterized protein B0T26DRAFT_670212 [Lasiosphaeria miniovina]KAK0733856.1 hypothetical protein B0T26DRAFT_670212 [Lasiosphaeria miniovina]